MDPEASTHQPETEADPLLAELSRREAELDKELGASEPAKPAAGGGKTEDQPSAEAAAGTPAASEAAQQSKEQSTEKQPEAKPSRFQKRSEEIQQQIAEAKAEKQKLADERAAFEKERSEHQARIKAEQAKQPQFTPEQYEAYADKMKAQAQELEAAGRFEEADEAKGLAAAARKSAKSLRDNPPAAAQKAAQADAEFARAAKEWAGKAFVDFPEVKPGGKLSQQLEQFVANEPAVTEHPKGLYYAAELIATKSEAARVPGLSKQVAELQAKVAELEQLTAPSIAGSGNIGDLSAPKEWDDMSVEEQQRALRREARG